AESGRVGHRHLWAVIPDDADRAYWRSRAIDLGLPPARQAMRPPGSPHRLGLATPILFPTGVALRQLPARITAFRRSTTGEREPLRWRSLLETGCWPAGYRGDRRDAGKILLICVGAIRDGLSI